MRDPKQVTGSNVFGNASDHRTSLNEEKKNENLKEYRGDTQKF